MLNTVVRLSPALDGGGGLKHCRRRAAEHGVPHDLSPALDGGGGLKLNRVITLPIREIALSPALDGGGGLKLCYLCPLHWMPLLSPALDGGGGLKPLSRGNKSGTCTLSPALDGGGGLKHYRCCCRLHSPRFPPRSMAGAD